MTAPVQRSEDVFELGNDDIVPPRKANPWKFILLGCGFFVILIMAAAGVVVFRLVNAAKDFVAEIEKSVEASDGATAFRSADSMIVAHHGEVGFGNSEAAIKLARAFSEHIGDSREELFTKRTKPAKFALSDGKFLVYCHLDELNGVFLVHVPDLRKFDKDAKEYMSLLAWVTAQKVIKESDIAVKPQYVAVGVRGMLLYDRVMHGELAEEGKDLVEAMKSSDEGDRSKMSLYTYFEPPIASDATPKDEAGADSPDSPKSETPKEDAKDQPSSSSEGADESEPKNDATATKATEEAKPQ